MDNGQLAYARQINDRIGNDKLAYASTASPTDTLTLPTDGHLTVPTPREETNAVKPIPRHEGF